MKNNEKKLNIAVIGGGGREHAIIAALRKSPRAGRIFALPGNGGIAEIAECVPVSATDLPSIVRFCTENPVDFCAVIPDDPLAMGLVDLLTEKGVPCFGPNKAAAVIEGSKAFAKELMKKYGIPTARYETFTELEPALECVRRHELPVVIKADGLALGKGVIIAGTREEAEEAVRAMMVDDKFGSSGKTVVIEEFLTGPEVSVLTFTDGSTVVPMPASMDHKRALDGDLGLNTGGMGVIAPNPFYTEELARRTASEIILPTVGAMNCEGRTFRGCLYFGLMMTPDGPKVIEYNCRFGDPETQVVLPLLKTDLLTIMQAVSAGTLSELNVEFYDGCACCVVLASEGYPLSYEKGYPITLPETAEDEEIYIAGAKRDGDALVTSGGRVLGAVARADDLSAAVEKAYALADRIHFDNKYLRRDIGQRALKA